MNGIILESGMGGCSLEWTLVQPELSKYATVVSYDRAGFGWSTKAMEHPTCENYVKDLYLLLEQLQLKPPYVLVGHSYGGMMMRLFASKYPNEVIGLVLVDSVHENRYLPEHQDGIRRAQREKNLKLFRFGYLLSPIAYPRLKKMHVGSKRLPSDVQKIADALGYRSNAYKALYYESLYADESSVQMQQAAPMRSDLPVIILSAGKQDAEWTRGQIDLLQLANQTEQIVVEDSWHSIQINKPQVVIESILSLLNGR